MKQFNLEEYLKNPSRKVVTRDGRSVRIVCTDRKSKQNFPIIALIEGFDGDEDFLCYPRDGKWPSCKKVDLFFSPEKREGWVNIYKAATRQTIGCLLTRYVGSSIWPTEESAKKSAVSDPIATIKIEWEE